MKKIILLLAVFISITCAGQVDSSTLKVPVYLRAADIEFIAAYFTTEHEDFYDGVKAKFRVGVPPTGVTLVQTDSIPVSQLLSMGVILRNNPGAISTNLYSRYSTVLIALGHSYVTRKLAEGDNAVLSTFPQMRKVGRFKLRRVEDEN
jgi:hypothetical protein